jgi:anti-sigma regulatory factor (Ser/Thr protein kinase)
MLPTILLVIFLANVYQMLGYLVLTPLIVLTFPLILIPSMYVWGGMGDGSLIWYAFPESGLLVLLLAFVITEVIRFRKKDVAHLTLVPTKDVENCYDISVEANHESMAASLANLDTYLADLGIGSELQLAVRHCIEEVTLNIVEHSGKNMEHHYFDIHTNFMDGVLEVIVKDDGRTFNPVALPEEERGSGLKILHGLCSNIDYKFMYGQNLTIMSWTLNNNK